MALIKWCKASVLVGSLSCLALGCASDHSATVGDGELTGIDKSKLASYAGSWDGYVEALTFTPSTGRLRVVLDENGNGRLQVGEGEILPPPTNPEVVPDALAQISSASYSTPRLLPLLAYPIAGAQVESERIRFGVYAAEAFTGWCELQTPNPGMAKGTYSCVPGAQHCTDPNNPNRCYATQLVWADDLSGYGLACDYSGTIQPLDCSKADLCLAVCGCSDVACTSVRGANIAIDAALSDDGHELVGTILLPFPGEQLPIARTLRLQR